MQKRFDLFQQTITLLNGTTYKYGNLKVPCCATCNNVHLGKIEQKISNALDGGAIAFQQLDRHLVHVWLGKIFYGILYKEMFLRRDIRSPKKTTIIDRRVLQQLPMLHYTLQGARYPMISRALQPEISFPLSSIFIFDIQEPALAQLKFNFRDSIHALCMSIVLGKVGIIAAFGDGGATRVELDSLVKEFKGVALHPLQYHEMEAIIFYKASLFNRTPKYIFQQEADKTVITQLPIVGLSSKPLFDPWDSDIFANIIAHFTGLDVSFLRPSPGQMRTFLHEADGSIQRLDFGIQPWPPQLLPDTGA